MTPPRWPISPRRERCYAFLSTEVDSSRCTFFSLGSSAWQIDGGTLAAFGVARACAISRASFFFRVMTHQLCVVLVGS